jgi:APA family basic amino acid/polyamine antiporter
MHNAGSERMLKKRINFFGLVSIFVGVNIGGALFSLTNLAADITGPSLPLAMFIASIPVILALVPYSMFSSAWPTTSATYRYSQLFSPPLAFIHMFTLLLCIIAGGQPLFAYTFGKYFNELVNFPPVWTGVIVFTLFYIVNLLGIKFTTILQGLLFIILMAALILYFGMGVPHVESVNFSPLFPNGIGRFFAASGILFTFCAGGLFVIDVGGEVIDASRRYKSALLTSMIIVVVTYLLLHVVTVGSVSWHTLKEQGTLIEVAKSFMGQGFLTFFVIGGALLACATTINMIFTIISRGLMVVSSEGLLPAFLGRVNKRFGTPHWGLTITYIGCTAALIVLTSPLAAGLADAPVLVFGAVTNFGLILSITVICLAGARVPRKNDLLYQRSRFKISKRTIAVFSWIAVVMNSIIFILLCMLVKKTAMMFFIFIAVSVIYYFIRIRFLKKRGIGVPGVPVIE